MKATHDAFRSLGLVLKMRPVVLELWECDEDEMVPWIGDDFALFDYGAQVGDQGHHDDWRRLKREWQSREVRWKDVTWVNEKGEGRNEEEQITYIAVS